MRPYNDVLVYVLGTLNKKEETKTKVAESRMLPWTCVMRLVLGMELEINII